MPLPTKENRWDPSGSDMVGRLAWQFQAIIGFHQNFHSSGSLLLPNPATASQLPPLQKGFPGASLSAVLGRFSRVQLCETPWTIARLLCPWDSPGKNTGVGCHALLQEIFPTTFYIQQGIHLAPRWILFPDKTFFPTPEGFGSMSLCLPRTCINQ